MAENLLQMVTGTAHDNVDGLMLEGYKGTLPLTMEMFPETPSPQWMIDAGLAKKGDMSNIITQLEGSDDIGWYLFPTMVGGKGLEKEFRGGNIKEFIDTYLGGKHFGLYDTAKEATKADSLIHDYFDRIKGYQQGGVVQALYSMI